MKKKAAALFREKNQNEILTEIRDLRKERLTLRMKRSQGEEVKTHRLKEIRRDIARLMTVLSEPKSGDSQ